MSGSSTNWLVGYGWRAPEVGAQRVDLGWQRSVWPWQRVGTQSSKIDMQHVCVSIYAICFRGLVVMTRLGRQDTGDTSCTANITE